MGEVVVDHHIGTRDNSRTFLVEKLDIRHIIHHDLTNTVRFCPDHSGQGRRCVVVILRDDGHEAEDVRDILDLSQTTL
ncbi:hypothetical protein D3C84_988300 [compost metagenome]